MLHFTMPGLSKYVFTYDGDAYSLDTAKKLTTRVSRRRKLPTDRYYLKNDRGVKEYVTKREIIQYGKHHRSLPETPRQFIERTLFKLEPGKRERFAKVQHRGNQVKWKK